MGNFEPHAVTDITGFGLAGHALEMARGSDVTLEIQVSDVPIMNQALDMYQKGMSTGVNAANRALIQDFTRFEKTLPPWHQEIFVDPQTSGGLLVAVSESVGQNLLKALHSRGIENARLIGQVTPLVESKHLIFT